MKKAIVILLLLSPIVMLNAQTTFSGGWKGGDVTVDFSGLRKSGGGQGNTQERYSSERESSPSIPSGETLGKTYSINAADAYKKAVKAWNTRDWDAVIKHCNTAVAYAKFDIGNQKIYSRIREQAKGYKEWDKGVEDADNNNYDKAIERFKNALEYLPEEAMLKTNIVLCCFNKITEAAVEYYNKENWVYAAAYYNVLWKNFDSNSAEVQTKYSECMSKIENMKKAEQGHLKYNAKLAEVQRTLDAKKRIY